jgi:hypothetical protein
LLEELDAGGVLSAVHTHNPPHEQWLVGMEHVCVALYYQGITLLVTY